MCLFVRERERVIEKDKGKVSNYISDDIVSVAKCQIVLKTDLPLIGLLVKYVTVEFDQPFILYIYQVLCKCRMCHNASFHSSRPIDSNS